MDPSLILLLIVIGLINLQSVYFGFYRKAEALAWLQQASFIITGFILIPLLVYVLYSQAGSTSRLEKFGIPIHADFAHAIGLGNGYGENPTWIFALKPNAGDILSFYAPSVMNPAWELKDANSLYVQYGSSNKSIIIAHRKHYGKDTVIITASSRQ